jgi:hypothetical protein
MYFHISHAIDLGDIVDSKYRFGIILICFVHRTLADRVTIALRIFWPDLLRFCAGIALVRETHGPTIVA